MASKPEEANAILQVKLKQLRIACGRTGSVLESNKNTAICRQIESLKALSADVEKSRMEVESLKIRENEVEETITEWNKTIEENLSKADDEIKRMEEWQESCQQEKKRNAFEEQMKYEVKLHEVKMKLELDRQAQLKAETSSSEANVKQVEAKLPKLVITKFKGSYTDWPRFWGQYTKSIEKSGLASITKFSYLRELLSDNVRREVESLPFTSEGYNRATAILKEKYGNKSEIVKAYVKEILSLPRIPSAKARAIAEFSDKLTYCVQSLQSLGKLDEVRGLTAITLDKLSAIRGDLVRSDGDWENWDLDKLAEA